MSSHRFFDHTGDFGADLEAESREALFAESARALTHLMVERPESIAASVEREIQVEGVDDEDLLVALGNELLYLFEVEGLLIAVLTDVAIDDGALHARAIGERFDPERHSIARPIKAVTHHGARVERAQDAYRARLIFDL